MTPLHLALAALVISLVSLVFSVLTRFDLSDLRAIGAAWRRVFAMRIDAVERTHAEIWRRLSR